MTDVNDYRARKWAELAEAERRADLTEEQNRNYRAQAEQIGYPWYGHAAQVVVATLCDYEDCDQTPVKGSDFCAMHDAEHCANMAEAEIDAALDAEVEAEREAERKPDELSQAARQALLDAGAYDNRD